MLLRPFARGASVGIVSLAVCSLVACVGVTEGAFDEGSSDAAADDARGSSAETTPSTPPFDTGVPAVDAGSDARAPDDTARPPDPIDGGAPSDGTKFPALVVGTITGAETAELTMIADGVALANATMKTACFHDYVLSASWTETLGLTQSQIYDKLCSGPITVDVDMYTGSWYENHVTHTVGYENEPGTVHMNRYYVDTAYMVADNLIHEGEGHSQGFRHDGVKATSVPYGLNAAFEACSPTKP